MDLALRPVRTGLPRLILILNNSTSRRKMPINDLRSMGRRSTAMACSKPSGRLRRLGQDTGMLNPRSIPRQRMPRRKMPMLNRWVMITASAHKVRNLPKHTLDTPNHPNSKRLRTTKTTTRTGMGEGRTLRRGPVAIMGITARPVKLVRGLERMEGNIMQGWRVEVGITAGSVNRPWDRRMGMEQRLKRNINNNSNMLKLKWEEGLLDEVQQLERPLREEARCGYKARMSGKDEHRRVGGEEGRGCYSLT